MSEIFPETTPATAGTAPGTPGQAACIAWNSHYAEEHGIEARNEWAASDPRGRGAWEAAAQAGHQAIAAALQPAPGSLRAALKTRVRAWLHDAEDAFDDDDSSVAAKDAFDQCAAELSVILEDHPAQPAPALRATLATLLADWREELAEEPMYPDQHAVHGQLDDCANALAAVLGQHPEAQPAPDDDSDGYEPFIASSGERELQEIVVQPAPELLRELPLPSGPVAESCACCRTWGNAHEALRDRLTALASEHDRTAQAYRKSIPPTAPGSADGFRKQAAADAWRSSAAGIRDALRLAAAGSAQPAPELAAKPRVDWARASEAVADRERERDEARERLGLLEDGIGNLAAGLKLSADASRPSKKSGIEDGCAAALLGLLDPR